MTSKGPLWTLLFFLILTYVVIITLEGPQGVLESPPELETAEGTTTLETHEAEPDAPGATNKAFTLTQRGILTLDPTPQAHDTFTLHRKEAGEWRELPLNETHDTFTPTPILETWAGPGDYVVATSHKESQDKIIPTVFGTAILITLLLLVLANHRHHRKQKHHHKPPSEEQAETYVRKALLAGRQESTVRTQLVRAGWPEDKVDSILQRVRFF